MLSVTSMTIVAIRVVWRRKYATAMATSVIVESASAIIISTKTA